MEYEVYDELPPRITYPEKDIYREYAIAAQNHSGKWIKIPDLTTIQRQNLHTAISRKTRPGSSDGNYEVVQRNLELYVRYIGE